MLGITLTQRQQQQQPLLCLRQDQVLCQMDHQRCHLAPLPPWQGARPKATGCRLASGSTTIRSTNIFHKTTHMTSCCLNRQAPVLTICKDLLAQHKCVYQSVTPLRCGIAMSINVNRLVLHVAFAVCISSLPRRRFSQVKLSVGLLCYLPDLPEVHMSCCCNLVGALLQVDESTTVLHIQSRPANRPAVQTTSTMSRAGQGMGVQIFAFTIPELPEGE
jgi:hypothetical protein